MNQSGFLRFACHFFAFCLAGYNQRKEMALFFAKYFSDLISECSENGLLSKLAIPELLKVQKRQLKEMILSSEKWEKNTNQLRVQMKKGKEQYQKLIQEAEKEE